MKIEINISNKVFYALMTLIVVIIVGVGVFATTPNPGHSSSQIDEADPQVGSLQDGQWCVADGSGSSGEIDCTEDPPTMTETDPTVDLARLKSLVSNDFHELGGTDAVDDGDTDNTNELQDLDDVTSRGNTTFNDIGVWRLIANGVTTNSVSINGQLQADSNIRGTCAWTSDIESQSCPEGRFVAGLDTTGGGSNMKLYCCEL